MDSGPTEEWKRNRKLTTIAFAILDFLIGCEYGVFVVNLWFYLTEMVQTSNPKMYYSLISVSHLLSAAGSSIIISHVADKTRKIRMTILVCCCTFIVGNIIYMFPFSPLLVLFGRIIAGIGPSIRSVTAGELARSYPENKTAFIFSLLGAAYSLGFMLAPGLNIVLSGTDIWLKKLHITYLNAYGIYMPALFLVGQLIVILMVTDLSLIYDQKEESRTSTHHVASANEDLSDEMETCDEAAPLQPEKEKSQPSSRLLIDLLTNADTFLLLFLQFLESGVVLFIDMLFPMIINDKLHWSHTVYNVIIIAQVVSALLPCLYLMFRTISDKKMYYIGVPSTLIYAVLTLAEMIWAMKLGSKEFNIFLAVIFSMGFGIVVLVRDVFVGSFLAKMVASRHQSSVDGIRVAVARIGCIVATFSAPYALELIDIFGPVIITVVVIFAFLMLLRRRTLKSPVVLID